MWASITSWKCDQSSKEVLLLVSSKESLYFSTYPSTPLETETSIFKFNEKIWESIFLVSLLISAFWYVPGRFWSDFEGQEGKVDM